MKVTINGDGSCNNKKRANDMGVGVVVNINGKVTQEIGKLLHKGTSNEAEWEAFILAIKLASYISKENKEKVEVIYKGDSQLVVKQWLGEYKNNSFPDHQKRAKYWLSNFKEKDTLKVLWVPREDNSAADALASVKTLKAKEKLKKKK